MIVFENVSKRISKKKYAVENLSFQVNEGETLVLLGKSGCGKSTTLKMINRLVDPGEGTIYVQGKNILKQDLVELRRKIGYAVQEISLFPHMTVEENIGIIPKLLKWPESQIEERVDHLLTIFGMDPKIVRKLYPRRLSGGQQQRVGVARALAADPPILLMDEPFGALDPITREQAQNEFRELSSKINKTVIFVTHDLFEAVAIGDRIALMDEGKLLQIATPREFIAQPPTSFADQFVGKHRFQLSLLTKPIFEYVEKGAQDEMIPELKRLDMQSSFYDALNLFRETRQKSLPVFTDSLYQGELKKEKLLDEVLELLMETPQDRSGN
ncbi:MAG: ATP-binding cassette domain-containing protein [Simkania sp.]|nr:ATP-binding cassette domain-containing protein [Simkania sp.]MCB1075722.1 ATP-binding cassette domain-containing protein [Simkania sp.]MCP5490984.1 ATP-binding cassette domain-containing protein [Chlamydiales bacterium]